MAKLVCHNGHQVVVRVDLPVDVRVEKNVAGIGAAVGRRRQERYGKSACGQRNRTDADVSEPRVVLLVAGGPDRLATVGNQCQVDVGRRFPRAMRQLRSAASRLPSDSSRSASGRAALGTPPTFVPSGMKLYVIRLEYVHWSPRAE